MTITFSAKSGLKQDSQANPSQEFCDLKQGTIISSRYTVKHLLGRGSSATVYLCTDNYIPGMQVALKLFNRTENSDQQLVRRMYREMLTCNNINHPNVTKFYDCIYSKEYVGYSMEYVDGRSMAALINTNEDVPLSLILKYFRQIMLGLSAVHSTGVVHRDLKPSNILCTSIGEIKISDFGVATQRIRGKRIISNSPNFDSLTEERAADTYTYTEDGCFVGTPRYLSPEYIEHGIYDMRSDLYAVGIILYELVTKSYPFFYESLVELLRCKVEDPPISPIQVRENCPLALNNLIMTLIASKPEERYSSANEVLEALNPVERMILKDESLDDESNSIVKLESRLFINSGTFTTNAGHLLNEGNYDPLEDLKKMVIIILISLVATVAIALIIKYNSSAQFRAYIDDSISLISDKIRDTWKISK